MLKISECVSLGHPDKVADYISEYLLDRYLEKDPFTRYAVEVQIKDNNVTLGGEVSSKAAFSAEQLAQFVREAVNEIGYTKAYQDLWGEDNTICGDDLQVTLHIGTQSRDIAQGLNGWGDQGIFFGYATTSEFLSHMPNDYALSKALCRGLYDCALEYDFMGLDIKTEVIMDDDRLRKIIVAVPLLNAADTDRIERLVRFIAQAHGYKDIPDIIINGTGAYKKHSSIADCGTTGRKLAVDFYGGNCRIGGGSPWTKDASKADLSLNLLARLLAVSAAKEYDIPVRSAIACCIGSDEIDVSLTDEVGNTLQEDILNIQPKLLCEAFGLYKPTFAHLCREGLFGGIKPNPWEEVETLNYILSK